MKKRKIHHRYGRYHNGRSECRTCGIFLRWHNSRREASVDGIDWGPNPGCIRVGLYAFERLAHNLAIAAGLCRAFELGLKINGHGWWFPGSGREAPILIGQVDASPVLCEICGAASRADRPCEGCGAP